jgi:tetratricopeptide (TPR) repeat protein
MDFVRASVVVLLCLLTAAGPSAPVVAQGQLVNAATTRETTATRERMHESEQWAQIQPHLPDPQTATAQTLEMQADILRARRFPQDAMDYYQYAIARGGNQPNLLNKLGLAELEMGNIQLGRVYFEKAVKLDRKNPDAWNNLGASEFIDGKQVSALQDYKRAVKLNKRKAVFHANLANAYFETKDFRGARREIAAALELDPQVFDLQGTGGVAAHVLSSHDLAQFSFEMAKMYARSGMTDQMLHALAKAAEAGMDVRIEMRKDPALAGYENDPRVVVLVHNALELRAGRPATVSAPGEDSPGSAKPL